MPLYTLPPKQVISEYLGMMPTQEKIDYVVSRVREAMKEAGYAVTENSVWLGDQNALIVDTDRDPSADWASFDIVNYRTPQERKIEQTRQAIITAMTTLENHADLLESATALTTKQLRDGVASTNRILLGLITLLIDIEVITEEAVAQS